MSDAKETPAKRSRTKNARPPVGSNVEFIVPNQTRPESPSKTKEVAETRTPENQNAGKPEVLSPSEADNQDSSNTESQETSIVEVQDDGLPAPQKAAGTPKKGPEAKPDPEPEPESEPDPIYTIKRTYNMTTDELTAVATMQTAALRRSGKKPDTSTIVRLAVQHFSQQPDHLEILLAHRRDMAKAKEQKAEADSLANQDND